MLGGAPPVDLADADPVTLAARWAGELDVDDPTCELGAVATAIATDHPLLDAEAAEHELRDRLRIRMCNAVVDAETLAAEVPLRMTGADLRARIEGEVPMTLQEYAHVVHALARRDR